MEIINREMKLKKTGGMGYKLQIAINNYGHLTLRSIPPEEDSKDILVVLSASETRDLIDFIKKIKTDV